MSKITRFETLERELLNRQPGLGFTPVPVSRKITINGLQQDLSGDQNWNITAVTDASLLSSGVIPDARLSTSVQRSTNIAGLRALTTPSSNIIYQTTDSGQEGLWRYDPADISSPDDTGRVLVSVNNKRFKRVLIEQYLNVKWFGAVGNGINDDTVSCNKAILAGAAMKIPVLFSDGTFLVNAVTELALQTNSHIILRNVTVKAMTANVGTYAIFSIRSKSNVFIECFNAVIEGERGTHVVVGTPGEYGMGITIDQSSNVRIYGTLTIKNCWGDAIYIGGGTTAFNRPKNIEIRDVITDNCRRQGISVTNVLGLKIYNTDCTNTTGTAPQCGMDFEPNAGCTVEDVYVENFRAINNVGGGWLMFSGYADAFIKNIKGKNIELTNSGGDGLTINQSTADKVLDIDINILKSKFSLGKGISLQGVTNCIITRLEIVNSGGNTNLYIALCKNLKIEKYNISDSGSTATGISLLSTNSDISIEGGIMNVGNYGIASVNTSDNTGLKIKYGKITSRLAPGLFLYNVHASDIIENKFLNCGEQACRFVDCNDNSIQVNVCEANGSLVNNQYAHMAFEGNSNINNIESNIFRIGGNANKAKYSISFTSGTANNFVTDNDFNGASLSTNVNDLSTTGNIVYENRHRNAGPTAQRPTGISVGFVYYNTTLGVHETWNGGSWVEAPGTVKDHGAAHTNGDGVNLTGTLISGSQVSLIVAAGTGFPSASGQVITYNGFSYERTYSIFKDAVSINMYTQFYNSSGVGLGWVLNIKEPVQLTTTQRNALPTQPEGTRIYNITTKTYDYWNGTAWKTIATL